MGDQEARPGSIFIAGEGLTSTLLVVAWLVGLGSIVAAFANVVAAERPSDDYLGGVGALDIRRPLLSPYAVSAGLAIGGVLTSLALAGIAAALDNSQTLLHLARRDEARREREEPTTQEVS